MKYIHATPEMIVLPIGRQGEGGRRTVIFDISEIDEEYSDAVYNVFVQRPYASESYTVTLGPVAGQITPAGQTQPRLSWVVTRYDTAVAGKGKCKIVAVKDSAVIMSREWTTEIEKSMPEPESFAALVDDD